MAKLAYFTIFLFFFVLCNLQETTADARKRLLGATLKKRSIGIKSESETGSVDYSESEKHSEHGKESDVNSDSQTEPEHVSPLVPAAEDCTGKPCNDDNITCKDPTCECSAIYYGGDEDEDKDDNIPDCIPKYDFEGNL